MLELANDLDSPQTLVYVQEEPALEIALPQVFEQPPLVALVRGKLSNVEGLISFIFRRHNENPEGVLGSEYQELVLEFQPLFSWSVACWDYLLSTEGCRFIPRVPSQKIGARGDYRAFTDKDYSRMVHAMFRSCVLEFAQRPLESSFSEWLRGRFWLRISEAYQQLSIPRDSRQRLLTPYSYLRCIPYQFLNQFHQDLVYGAIRQLPLAEAQAIETYFLHFYTEETCTQLLGCSTEELTTALRQGLLKLLITNRLAYCLLRQIERY